MSLWQITSVDTMKDSKDTCYPTTLQLSDAVIAQGVNLAATLNVTHITVDCTFDYPAYMARWVAAVRAAGKSVWFRCQWAGWEGIQGQSQTLTPTTYLSQTIAFIQANPTLFQSGDILDACPEATNSSYWSTTYGGAGWSSSAPTAGTTAANQFLMNLDTQIQATLQALAIFGVNTKIHSVDISWAKDITKLYPATVAQHGCVTFDSYPEGSSTDPNTCAALRLADLTSIQNARPGVNIVIGEMGYANAISVTDDQQNAVLAAEFAAIATVPAVIGMNYWVAMGTDTSGGYTHIFGNVRGAWTLRPAAITLANFYMQQRLGWLDASAQSIAISGANITPVAGSLGIKNAIGQRSTAQFVVLDPTGTLGFVQGQPVTIKSGGGNGSPNQTLFTGYVATAKRTNPGWSATLIHSIACMDQHYLADKRIAATSYANQNCGAMFTDLVNNYLAAEGVTIQRGVNLFTAQQSDFENGTDLTGIVAGSGVTLSVDNTTSWHGTHCLKAVTSGGSTFQQVEVRVAASAFGNGVTVTISFYGKAGSGTPTIRFFLDSDTGAIGGTGNITLSTTWTRYTRTITLPNPIAQVLYKLRWDTGGVAQAITVYMDALQIEVAGAASAWELGGLQQSVQAGPTVTAFLVNYVPVSKAFDDLAQLAGFTWQIDYNKVAWFVAPATITAPWVYDGTQADDSSGGQGSAIEETNPLYRNGQWILGIKDVTSSQTESRKGDGANRVFTMSYPLHSTPTVTVNSVAKTVGIGQVDTGKDFYWNQGKNEIFQDPAGTLLTSADTFQAVYIGEWTSNAYAQSAGAVAMEAAIEGGGTGIVEEAHSDSAIQTTGQGFQLANALLSRYAQIGRTLNFRTRSSGLAPQQLLTVNLPPAWGMSGVQALIEEVDISEDNTWWIYDVKALVGPVNDTWVQYLQRIANPLGLVPGSSGSSQTVAILQPETAAWNWSSTYTATVTSCPVFPITLSPATLC